MVFSGSAPVAGQTSGRNNRETNKRACSGWPAVKGRVSTSAGGWKRGREQGGKCLDGHGQLIGGNRQAALGDVEHALGGAAVAEQGCAARLGGMRYDFK